MRGAGPHLPAALSGGAKGWHSAGIMGAVIHEVWGDETEFVRAAAEWAAQRVVQPTDSKTTVRPASELAAAAGRTVTPAGTRGTEALRAFRDVLLPATRSQDDPTNLVHLVGADARRRVVRGSPPRPERRCMSRGARLAPSGADADTLLGSEWRPPLGPSPGIEVAAGRC
jgi:hypothetical protein